MKVEHVSDGRKLCFSEKLGGKIKKDYSEMVTNEQIDLNHNMEGAVECPVACVSMEGRAGVK